MPFLAGKNGRVLVGAVSYRFHDWTADIQTDILDSTNFTSGGFKENIDGLQGAKITVRGLYDHTAMLFASGSVYTFLLYINNANAFTMPARISNIKIITDVSKAVEVEITAETTGAIDVAMVQ